MVENVAVIGAGVIGGAIAKTLLKSGYSGKITTTRRKKEKMEELQRLGATTTDDNRKAAEDSDIIFICVKPKSINLVLREIHKELEGKLVISTAATVPLSCYKKIVPKARFVRTMPNVAILVQESFTAYCCDQDITSADKDRVETILGMMGICEEVDEKYMDAITALSGSGPGYLSIITEALMYAGLKVGLPRDLALYSSAQAVLGTGKLVLKLREHPSKIKDMVTTPGGTTIEAIYELEGSQIRRALMRAVVEATNKSSIVREEICKNSA